MRPGERTRLSLLPAAATSVNGVTVNVLHMPIGLHKRATARQRASSSSVRPAETARHEDAIRPSSQTSMSRSASGRCPCFIRPRKTVPKPSPFKGPSCCPSQPIPMAF